MEPKQKSDYSHRRCGWSGIATYAVQPNIGAEPPRSTDGLPTSSRRLYPGTYVRSSRHTPHTLRINTALGWALGTLRINTPLRPRLIRDCTSGMDSDPAWTVQGSLSSSQPNLPLISSHNPMYMVAFNSTSNTLSFGTVYSWSQLDFLKCIIEFWNHKTHVSSHSNSHQL